MRLIVNKVLCAFLMLLVAGKLYSQQNPNVLFIAIDDLNDWVGCLDGHPQTKTPNIDRLAAQGVLFTNAHCQAPICGPSRASIMTGLYPHTSGNYLQLNDPDIKKSNDVTANSIFLPDYFEKHGYKSFGVGKVYHNGDAANTFDEYGGVFEKSGPKPAKRFNYDPKWFNKPGKTQTDWGAYPDVDEKMPDYKSASWAIERLKEDHENPFFMAVGFVRPHVPWYVPQKWFDKFPIDSLQMPPYLDSDMDDVPLMGRRVAEAPQMPTTEWMKETDQWKKVVQAYLACISFVDYQVGRVLENLENSKYKDNTIVVLWSDHGYHLGEKNRVAKQALWERDTRTVLIFKTLDGNANQVCSRPVQLIDMYPTLVDLAGLPKNQMNEGHSLVPLLENPFAKWDYPALTSYGKGNFAVTTEGYRLIQYEDNSIEFYDLRNDKDEWHNLAGDKKYRKLINQHRSHLPEKQAELSSYSHYSFNEYFKDKSQ
ncbi:MAG: sulfatase [Cytophagales bacterium]|nr:sulfatase [Cytophagales bacterium]